MKYVRLFEGEVTEILPEENPDFPGIPISERYSKDFLSALISVPEDIPVKEHYLYDAVKNTFTSPSLVEISAQTGEATVDGARAAALLRIDGKCEEAIISDLTVDGVVYPMTRGTAQDDLARAVARASSGDLEVPYGPHGQFASLYPAAQVLKINKALCDRIIINRTYYGLLQAWIGVEENILVLDSISYETALPKDYTMLLASQMAEVKVDASSFLASKVPIKA